MANEKRVRANNVSGTITDNPLTNVATTMNSAGLASLPAVTSANHAVVILEPGTANEEIVYVTAHTASATSATIARGQEGTSGIEHAQNAAWVHGPTVRDQAVGRVAFVTITSGDLSLNSANWTSAGVTDLTVAAQAGDVLEFGLSARWANQATSGYLDALTVVGGSPVTPFGNAVPGATTGNGIDAIGCTMASQYINVGGSVMLLAGAGDVSGGTVTVRLYYKTSGAKTLGAGTASSLRYWLKNHGPQES